MRSQFVENCKVVPVDFTKLIAGVEQALCLQGHAGNDHVTEPSDGEERPGKLVPSATQRSLTGMALLVDHQRMDVHPAPSGCRELNPVRPPVGLDGVSQVTQCSQDVVLECPVDVEVDIPMRPGLVAHQGIDSPAPFEPESAAHGTHSFEYGELLLEAHARRIAHSVIVTDTATISAHDTGGRAGARPPVTAYGRTYLSSAELSPRSRRAMMSSWICWVPSKMSRILESRDHFSSSSTSL